MSGGTGVYILLFIPVLSGCMCMYAWGQGRGAESIGGGIMAFLVRLN